ncbi:Type IV secretory system Conjugative DNA transfer [compost metagenome]
MLVTAKRHRAESGKGVGIVIPNLLIYPDSVVVNDPQFENFEKTPSRTELDEATNGEEEAPAIQP